VHPLKLFRHQSPAGALPRKDREQLLANCEQIELIFAQKLNCPESPFRTLFPDRKLHFLDNALQCSTNLEVTLIVMKHARNYPHLGVDVAPFHALVLGAGPALRMTAPSFLRELKQNPALQQELSRYLYVSISQLAQTAACTASMWWKRASPLAVDDSGPGALDHFHVTHELIPLCWV